MMLPKTSDVLTMLETCAPSQLAESWDNPGLQVGSYSQEITKIFMALDPTLKSLRNAVNRNAQLLLTHHPLIFSPRSSIDIDAFPGNALAEAVKHGISVVTAHTNLDKAAGGINDILTDLLGLENVEVLEEMTGMEKAGLGRLGDLPEAMTLSSLVAHVKQILGSENLKVCAHGDMEIRRIAVVGGSGGSLVGLSAKKGADLLITGEVGHHHALEAASLDMAIIDAGHFSTEKAAFMVFAEHFKKMITDLGWKVVVEIDDMECDPFTDESKP